jgi:hypothetical protein
MVAYFLSTSILQNIPNCRLNGETIRSTNFTAPYIAEGNNALCDNPPLARYKNGV